MTKTLLHITASPRGALSQSRRVGAALVSQLLAKNNLTLVTRDLGSGPPPHPDAAFMNASLRLDRERNADEHEALIYSETLLGELAGADLVIIDTPMHNFTLPSVLKTWIDYVVRPARSFALSPQGKLPLLKDRPVRIAIACGGRFSGPTAQSDFLTPYLRYVLATIGLTDIDFLLMEQIGRTDEDRAVVAQRAGDWIKVQLAQLGDRLASAALTIQD
jgi:FMN-dependent NADH-azoreductase